MIGRETQGHFVGCGHLAVRERFDAVFGDNRDGGVHDPGRLVGVVLARVPPARGGAVGRHASSPLSLSLLQGHVTGTGRQLGFGAVLAHYDYWHRAIDLEFSRMEVDFDGAVWCGYGSGEFA